MAIYHLSAKPISRSKGRSATAAAAYRAGVVIADERTGLVHDYRRRSGVDREHSPGVVLPAGASAELYDPTTLWNAAELAEKRKDACVAREYEIALPGELSPIERGALVREFAEALAERHGVAVDARIHAPDREGDQRNWHAHVMTTTRVAGPDGLGPKAEIERAGRDRKADLYATRQLWEGLANAALEQAGRAERVDARSLAARGIRRPAEPKLGQVAVRDLRRHLRSDGEEPLRTAAAKRWLAVKAAIAAAMAAARLALRPPVAVAPRGGLISGFFSRGRPRPAAAGPVIDDDALDDWEPPKPRRGPGM